MLTDPQLQLIRDAAKEGPSEHEIRQRLQELDDEGQSLRPAILAFGFHFLVDGATEARERHSSPWGPMVEFDGQQFPPPLDSLEEDVLAAWRQMLEAIDEPAVQARCGDLLWVRKHGARPDLAARAAVTGYLALAEDDDWRVMERTEGLGRALEIARELRDDALAAEVARNLSAAADREMSSEEDRPGVALRLLQPLVALPAELRPDGLLNQLHAAGERYGADPFIAQAVDESIAQLSTPEQRQDIHRRTVRRWIDEAGKGDALMRVIRLQQALELALASNLKDEADEIRVLMGAVPEDDLELAAVSAEVSIPRAEIDALGEQFSALDLPEALRAFGAYGPPTGSPTAAEEASAEMMRQTPLASLIPRVVLGEVYPTPIFKADTPEKKQRLEVAEYRARLAQIWGIVAASVLDAIHEAHEPGKDQLDDALTNSLFTPDVRERVAQAFVLYLEERYDECVHLLTPRLEAALRTVAAAAGVPVTVPPNGEVPGGVVTLGTVLSGLEGRLDEGWRQYLIAVLTDRLGLNLRNAVSHGLRGTFGKADAALLLHVACLMVGWQLEERP